MAAISFDTEYTITTAAPGLVGKALYSVDSKGNVSMTVYTRCNSNGAWANDPWCAWVNGAKQQIKARTSGTLGKTWYSTTYSLGKTYSGTIKWSSYNNNSGTTEYTWSIPTPTWNVIIRISNMDVYGNYGGSWVWVNENVQRGNSVSYTAYSGDNTYNAVSYSNSELTGNVDTTLYASRKTGTFNLNILMPDDVTEPYQTGRAGTVQMSTDGGSTWSGNIYNEPASSYYIGRSLKFRNFYPGEGLKYKSVSGVDGNWAATQGSALTVNFYTAYESYYLDLNGMLDGTSNGGLGDYGRATVIVNGTTVGNQVSDYYAKHPYDQSYSITNITPLSGYRYNGVYSGSTSGTIGLGKTVVLNFSTIEPSNLQINGSATTPFNIDLNWSATGINITNYTVYYNGVAKNCGTSTSTTLEVSPETTYNIYFTATNAGGTTTSSSINITTPADQAKGRIKTQDGWRRGKIYYKRDGEWKKVKKIYRKVNDQWVIGTNIEPGDLTFWRQSHSGVWDINYNPTTGLSRVICNGQSGWWEQLYKICPTTVGATYTVSFDYYNPNGYSADYGGIECQASNALENNNGDARKIAYASLGAAANSEVQHLSFTFTASAAETCVAFNFGRGSDTTAVDIYIGNIFITQN